jgi:outer membrane lipase/esterase
MAAKTLASLLLLSILPASVISFDKGVPIHSLYVLGDSLTDQGNVYLATSVLGPQLGLPVLPDQDHYFQGRFSNGEVYAGILAEQLGVTLEPSLAGGRNYAFGGARTDYSRLEPPLGPYPAGAYPWTLDAQRAAFLAEAGPRRADPTGLYVVFSGSNDIADILQFGLDPAATIAKTVEGIRNVVLAFEAAGARHVVVINVPDLGVAPAFARFGPAVAALATALAQQYNATLDAMLADISSLNIIRFDSFALMGDVVADPGAYGLTNVTDPCYSGFVEPNPAATECPNPQDYLFWDFLHPTTVFHGILADELFLALGCEPAGRGQAPGRGHGAGRGRGPVTKCALETNVP